MTLLQPNHRPFQRKEESSIVSDSLLALAARRYGFDIEQCRFLTGGRDKAKMLYTFAIKGEPYILRFVKGPATNLGQVKAEMDWLLYLSGHGAGVPRPKKTLPGELALCAEDQGETYLLCAFRMGSGAHWDKNDPHRWNAHIFYQWGKAAGTLHRLSKDYIPAKGIEPRPTFKLSSMLNPKIRDFPSVHQIAGDLLAKLEALPRDRECYGLIHNDLHPGNFLIDGEGVHLFDFDDCMVSWYALDIATALYLALWFGRKSDAGQDFTADIIRHFLGGYRSANNLDAFWRSQIPHFMMACKIALFSLGCDCENPENGVDAPYQPEHLHQIEQGVLFPGLKGNDPLFHTESIL